MRPVNCQVDNAAGQLTAASATALRPQPAAWYDKREPTFSDAIAMVRRALWCPTDFSMSRISQGTIEIATTVLHRLLQTACYAA